MQVVPFFYSIFEYREYLRQSVLRDLRVKYKRSALGYLWTMIHPLGMMAIISVVFSHIMRIPVQDYSIFLFAGLLPWNYFQSTALMSLNSIKSNAKIFGQVPVPKYLFILSLCASNLVNYFLALIPLFLLMLCLGREIPLTALLFPLTLIPLLAVVIGVSLILATANVFFDDTLHLSEVAFQALYFLSPVLYGRDMLPPSVVAWLEWNPLFLQIETVRAVLYGGVVPDMAHVALNCALSFIVLLFGLYVFMKNEQKFLYMV